MSIGTRCDDLGTASAVLAVSIAIMQSVLHVVDMWSQHATASPILHAV